MQSRAGTAMGILMTILALFIGLFGIAVLVGVGEAANNAITAFAAVSFPFALLAGFLSWLTPQARWAIAIAMFTPVAFVSILGSWSGGFLGLGAVWTVAFTSVGAYLGARLKRSRSGTQNTPPS